MLISDQLLPDPNQQYYDLHYVTNVPN